MNPAQRYTRLERIVRGIWFRGWTFRIDRNLRDWMLEVRVRYIAPDATLPIDAQLSAPPADVRLSERVPEEYVDSMGDEEIVAWFFQVLVLRAVRHEACEFFRFEGRRVFDPHGWPEAWL